MLSHLETKGYEHKLLGNSELPFTFWYNFLFINIYYLIIKKLQTFKDKGFVKLDYVVLNANEELEISDELCYLIDRLFSKLDQYLKSKN